MIRLLLALLGTACLAAAAEPMPLSSTSVALITGSPDLPTLAAGTWECHGTATLAGQTQAQRFWLRLLPPDAKFGGNRMLQLVYTPADPAALGGTHLGDSPFLLLDEHARLVAWNDRAGLTQATSSTKAGATYHVTRERMADETVANQAPHTVPRSFSGERGWEATTALLLLALAWRADTRAQIPLYDLFGEGATAAISWSGTTVSCAGRAWRIEADAQGRLKRLLDEHGMPLVIVQEWLKEGL